MTIRVAPVLALGLLVGAGLSPLAGQDSPFGINGLGTPGRFESARARATGGAFAAFDALSALTDASASGLGRLTASATGTTSYLSDDLGAVSGSRRSTRFPLFQIGGPAWSHVVLVAGVSTYLDRSYHVVVHDTVALGGSQQAVTDNLSGDGGVSDIRFAAARRFGHVVIGAGLHLLSGSSRFQFTRNFSDTSTYGDVTQAGEVAYRGMGFSGSAIVAAAPHLELAGFWRSDTRLSSEEDGKIVARHDLPTTLGGAIRWQPAPEATFGASLTHRGWASAADSNAYNTTTWSVGAEFGRRLPLRLGARGGELPFGPGGQAPRETAFAVGTGRVFAGGRGLIDVTVERLRRTGAGLTETGWTALFGVAVRP
ncbi:MAG TPA: hypothetical protein VKO86_11045 [Gemmatimonadales bacterium]|nr:hypothetical protein [Gemmatimonadales bacterium]